MANGFDDFAEGFASTFSPGFASSFKRSQDRFDDAVADNVKTFRANQKLQQAQAVKDKEALDAADSIIKLYGLPKEAKADVASQINTLGVDTTQKMYAQGFTLEATDTTAQTSDDVIAAPENEVDNQVESLSIDAQMTDLDLSRGEASAVVADNVQDKGFFAKLKQRATQTYGDRLKAASLVRLGVSSEDYDAVMTSGYTPTSSITPTGAYSLKKPPEDIESLDDAAFAALQNDPEYIAAVETNDTDAQLLAILNVKKKISTSKDKGPFGTSLVGGLMNAWILTDEGSGAFAAGDTTAISKQLQKFKKALDIKEPATVELDMANPQDFFFKSWQKSPAGIQAMENGDTDAITAAMLESNDQGRAIIKKINETLEFVPEDVTSLDQIPTLKQKYRANPAILGQLDAIRGQLLENVRDEKTTAVVATSIAERQINDKVGFVPENVKSLNQLPGLREKFSDNKDVLAQLDRIEKALRAGEQQTIEERLITTSEVNREINEEIGFDAEDVTNLNQIAGLRVKYENEPGVLEQLDLIEKKLRDTDKQTLESRLRTTFETNKELNESVGFDPQTVTNINQIPGLRERFKDNEQILEQLELIQERLLAGITLAAESRATGTANVTTTTPKPKIVYQPGEEGLVLIGNGIRQSDGLYINGKKVPAEEEYQYFTTDINVPIKAESIAASDWIKKKNTLIGATNFAESALTYLAYYETAPEARTAAFKMLSVGDTIANEISAIKKAASIVVDGEEQIDRTAFIAGINAGKFAPGVKQVLSQEAGIIFDLAKANGQTGNSLSNKDYDNFYKTVFNSNDIEVIRDNIERQVYGRLSAAVTDAKTISGNPGASFLLNQGNRWWDNPLSYALEGRSEELNNFVAASYKRVQMMQQSSSYSGIKILTAEDISKSESLQNLGAEPGDRLIDNKLHKALK